MTTMQAAPQSTSTAISSGTARIEVLGRPFDRSDEILTPEALQFLTELHHRFASTRHERLADRQRRRYEIGNGRDPKFRDDTRSIREDASWRVAGAGPGLEDRRVEITGPTDPKMTVNAMNSGARVWLADQEDATSPTWRNVIGGQLSLYDAIREQLEYTSPEGKEYRVTAERTPTIVMRPRGWHLVEKHIRFVDAQGQAGAASGSLVDFGLYAFHNARVLIETLPAAFEMEEILYVMRDHIAGLNAGRWDYIFSIIKNYRGRGARFVLPDRSEVTMTVPFMRAYTELLVKTCHRRGAHAIGGMSAFIPNRRDPEVTARAEEKVRADKHREANDGFDGTWVAHPDLIPVAQAEFDAVLGGRANQVDRQRDDVEVTAAQLLDVRIGRDITEAGVRDNVSVGIRYIEAWLRGLGAVALDNLMEDAATAEISRSQIWQWIHQDQSTAEGTPITRDWVAGLVREAVAGFDRFEGDRYDDAAELFADVALGDDFPTFLTVPAYSRYLVDG
jgi:malate synthase